MSASLIGRLGSSAFRLSITTVSMSLTGSCFSSKSAPGPLYGAFLVKKFKRRAAHLFSFIVRFESPFLPPDPGFTHLAVSSATARLLRSGWRSEGSPLAGAINRATTLYPVGPKTRTMMQSCASAAKLRSGGPILPIGTKAKGHCRDSATSNRHRRSITSGRTKPKLSGCLSTSSIHCAERKTTPSGTTPCRTSRHRAIRSLRAKARLSSSVSRRSVFARRCSRDTATLAA